MARNVPLLLQPSPLARLRQYMRVGQYGHPDAERLEKLADVINEKADISVLDDWEEWQKA